MDKAYSNVIKALCLFAETLLGFILGKVWKNVKNIMKKRIKINNIRRANKIVKEIQVKKPKKTEAVGPAFHQKSAKNSKVNVKMRHEEKMKKKYDVVVK